MRRFIFLTIIQFFLYGMFGLVFSQQRNQVPVKLEKITAHIYQIVGGRGANGGAFIGEKGVVIIDAKMNKESVAQTIAEVKKLTDKPIKYLISTHSDGDHIAGNRYFPNNIIFVAHENCRKEFFHPDRNGGPSEWENPELRPYIPSVTFKEKMDLYLGNEKIELWYFGVGHTKGDAVVYFPKDKIAFIGDQIFTERPQLIHSYKGGNSFEHVKTVTKMLETLDIEKICTGHSDIFGPETVKKHLQTMTEMQDKIKTLVKENLALEDIQAKFNKDESRLVESIFNEIKSGSM